MCLKFMTPVFNRIVIPVRTPSGTLHYARRMRSRFPVLPLLVFVGLSFSGSGRRSPRERGSTGAGRAGRVQEVPRAKPTNAPLTR